jgi:hypothetical protein
MRLIHEFRWADLKELIAVPLVVAVLGAEFYS